ncbi:MAG: DUF4445 domain-containing protein [Spirochaetales bacterium]|nr:DUF4445 domain-containing protein [Spirochaetales bacterium]
MSILTLIHRKDEYIVTAIPGTNLLNIIQDLEIPGFNAPCGGKGTCGKCRIILKKGVLNPVTEQEKALLDSPDIANGIRMACCCTILKDSPITILVPEAAESRIQASSTLLMEQHHPRFRSLRIAIDSGTLNDQRSSLSKIVSEINTLGLNSIQTSFNPSVLHTLGSLTNPSQESTVNHPGEWHILMDKSNLKDIQHTKTMYYGCAVDIGTTTIVVHLVNLLDGTILGTWSGLNEQKRYGADVISRIQFCMEQRENTGKLQKTIVNQIDDAIKSLFIEASIPEEHLQVITIAGNTTMLHFLTGSDTSGIAASPFIPIFTDSLSFSSTELGFSAIPHTKIELLPSIAAYVGADISAGVSVTNLLSKVSPTLFLDIGTNGEMALGDNGRVVCCSTAAGPAFEGANIRYGTGGIAGAIDSVKLENGKILYTTIGNKPPIGICGSGIIDAAALLISSGAADYTGRIESQENFEAPWIVVFDGAPALLLASIDETNNGTPIVFTQKDLREVQLAKAAVAGGIRTLLKDRNISLDDVAHVYLAGGFGSYINPENAGIIGLLPGNLSEKTETAGNTSGQGALRALLDKNEFDNLQIIQENCFYIELSARADFQQFYIEEMYFGDY